MQSYASDFCENMEELWETIIYATKFQLYVFINSVILSMRFLYYLKLNFTKCLQHK